MNIRIVIRIRPLWILVLALLIPVVAGMGLNFSITIGAMAAQIAIIAVAYLGIQSGFGLFLTFVISAPIALILGKVIGKLLNRTRGQEMIASMITGFFADGIYQLIDGMKEAGKTVFLIEHNMEFVRNLADVCHFLEDGVLSLSGTPAEVLSHRDVKESYLQ